MSVDFFRRIVYISIIRYIVKRLPSFGVRGLRRLRPDYRSRFSYSPLEKPGLSVLASFVISVPVSVPEKLRALFCSYGVFFYSVIMDVKDVL